MFIHETDATVFQQIPLHCALSSQQWSWTRAVGWRYNLCAQETRWWLVQGHTATYWPHRTFPSQFCGGLLRFPTLHDGVLHLTQQQAKCVEGLWKLGKVMHWVYKWMNNVCTGTVCQAGKKYIVMGSSVCACSDVRVMWFGYCAFKYTGLAIPLWTKDLNFAFSH